MPRSTINSPSDGRCGYIAIYGGREAEVWENTLYGAKQRAIAYFKPPKSKQHLVTVMLAEKDGQPVTHTPVD